MSRVHFAPAAHNDLNEIWSYIAGESPEAASRFVDAMERKCEWLADFPRLGRPRDELAAGLRSILFDSYVIFYCLAADQVEIVRILSGYQDLEAQFEQ